MLCLFGLGISLYVYGDALYLFGDIVVGKLFYNFFGTVNDHVRHTCQTGYLDTVALVRTAPYNFTQKHNIVPALLDGDAVIVDIAHFAFQLGQFVVMGGK